MRGLNRRGFTLAGLLVALVLFGLIGLAITRVVTAAERNSRALRGHTGLQAAFDLGTGYLDEEFADLAVESGRSDLLRATPESLSYRASRGTGLACRVSPTEVVVPEVRLHAYRTPQPGRDSLLLLLPVVAADSPSRWITTALTSVATSSCGSMPALRFGTLFDTAGLVLPAPPALVPIRVFEVMQVRLYSSLGEWWLGARSESSGEGIQPLAGPFRAPDSRFLLLDSTGGVTSAAAEVRTISARLAGSRAPWGNGDTMAVESVTARYSPGNLWP